MGEAAKILGVSKNTLMNYESGRTPIKAETLEAMSALYDMPIENIDIKKAGAGKAPA